MQEISTPALVDMDPTLNITELLEQQAENDPHNVLYSVNDDAGTWRDVTAAEFRADVVRIAKGLIASGIEPGDRVAIMSTTRYEWVLADFAVWYAGAVSVPVYETSAASQIAWILKDSGAKLALVENAELKAAVDSAAQQEDLQLMGTLTFEGGDLETLREAGVKIDGVTLRERRTSAAGEDLATLIYTSGTTGNPKGCELTHANFTVHCAQTIAAMDGVLNKDSSTVLFLPLAHVFARWVSVLFVAMGGRVAHTSNIKHLVDDLGAVKPTFLLGVPRVFEKVYNSAHAKAEAEGKAKIFLKAVNVAAEYSQATTSGKASLKLRAQHALFSRLVYSKLRKRMGGNVTHAFSGGSPLGSHTSHFFNGIGIQIIEGYGLTETTAPITGNIPSVYRIGTVGTPLPGNAIRIAEDGEILGTGTALFRGYYNNDDANAESFVTDEDGTRWFRTGDLGELDDAGRLTITGRKKDILVTQGGKNVSPAQLEDAMRADVLISQAVVVGDDKPFIGALITLDEEMAPGWCERNGIDPETPMAELTEHPKVIEHVQSVVDRANESVSQAESIRSFTILQEDFTISAGHLTPSLKIKRPEVMRDFDGVVESLYARAAAAREAAHHARERAAKARDKFVANLQERRHHD